MKAVNAILVRGDLSPGLIGSYWLILANGHWKPVIGYLSYHSWHWVREASHHTFSSYLG